MAKPVFKQFSSGRSLRRSATCFGSLGPASCRAEDSSLTPSDRNQEMAAKPIPDGFQTVTPYLVVQEVDKVIDFVIRAFAAKERFRHLRPDGKTGHAEVTIGRFDHHAGRSTGTLEGDAHDAVFVREQRGRHVQASRCCRRQIDDGTNDDVLWRSQRRGQPIRAAISGGSRPTSKT